MDEEPLEDTEPPPLAAASCDDTDPLISFDLTISCFASLLFVPGFVRLIFIFRPLSTVAECSTAILPGLPVFPCALFTPLTTALFCLLLVPVMIAGEPFAFAFAFAFALPLAGPLLPALLTTLPFPCPFPLLGLFDRPDELRPQEDGADDDNDNADEHEEDDDKEDDDDEDEDDDDDDDEHDDDDDDDEDDDDVEELEDCPQPLGPVDATTDEDRFDELKPFVEF